MATRGICTIAIPATNPFIETTRIGNKFPDSLVIPHADFVHNPTPTRVEFEASEDESYPEVPIAVNTPATQQVSLSPQPHQQAQQPN